MAIVARPLGEVLGGPGAPTALANARATARPVETVQASPYSALSRAALSPKLRSPARTTRSYGRK
jgi:hypothetical protein